MGKETELNETKLYAKIGKLFMELEYTKQRSTNIMQEINQLNAQTKEADDEPQTIKQAIRDQRRVKGKASGKNKDPKQDDSDIAGQN